MCVVVFVVLLFVCLVQLSVAYVKFRSGRFSSASGSGVLGLFAKHQKGNCSKKSVSLIRAHTHTCTQSHTHTQSHMKSRMAITYFYLSFVLSPSHPNKFINLQFFRTRLDVFTFNYNDFSVYFLRSRMRMLIGLNDNENGNDNKKAGDGDGSNGDGNE